MESIFSKLPNDIIMKIIKINTEEFERELVKDFFSNFCLIQLRDLSAKERIIYGEDFEPPEYETFYQYDQPVKYYLDKAKGIEYDPFDISSDEEDDY